MRTSIITHFFLVATHMGLTLKIETTFDSLRANGRFLQTWVTLGSKHRQGTFTQRKNVPDALEDVFQNTTMILKVDHSCRAVHGQRVGEGTADGAGQSFMATKMSADQGRLQTNQIPDLISEYTCQLWKKMIYGFHKRGSQHRKERGLRL